MTSQVAAVVAGLAAGIAFIAVFSVVFKPLFILSDDDIRRIAGDVPEVQTFRERFGDAFEEIRREGTTAYLEYSVTHSWLYDPNPPNEADAIASRELNLKVWVNESGVTFMDLTCHGYGIEPNFIGFHATIDGIENNRCLSAYE